MNPMLCRLCAYFAPGLPRPTKSRMARHPALARDQQKWKPVLRPSARQPKNRRMIFRQTAHTLAGHALYFFLSPPAGLAPAAGAFAPPAGAAPAAGAAAPAAGAAPEA